MIYAEIQYICTGKYNNKGESGIHGTIHSKCGMASERSYLSKKDETAQTFEEWTMRPESDFFKYLRWTFSKLNTV
jgi:hypothetical protein